MIRALIKFNPRWFRKLYNQQPIQKNRLTYMECQSTQHLYTSYIYIVFMLQLVLKVMLKINSSQKKYLKRLLLIYHYSIAILHKSIYNMTKLMNSMMICLSVSIIILMINNNVLHLRELTQNLSILTMKTFLLNILQAALNINQNGQLNL